MIAYLDKALNDMEMTVYVDKNGNLAAVDGTTAIYVEDEYNSEDSGNVQVDFSCRLEGGTYPTENLKADIRCV